MANSITSIPKRLMISVLSISLFFASLHAQGEGEKANRSQSKQDIAKLIDQLGDAEFTFREEAEKKLVQTNHQPELVTLLKAATKNSDAEIRIRSIRILKKVNAIHYADQVNRFANGKIDDLPHWKEFKSKVGSSPKHRELFVRMIKAEPELMQIPFSNSNRLTIAFNEKLQENTMTLRFQRASSKDFSNLTDSRCVMLFLSTYKDNFVGGSKSYWLRNALNYSLKYKGVAPKIAPYDEPLRDLFRDFLLNCDSLTVYTRLSQSNRLEYPNATMTLARKVIQDAPTSNYTATAILHLANSGGEKTIPEIQKLLTNKSVLYKQTRRRNKKITIKTSETRDVALAALISITKQQPTDFEFQKLRTSSGIYVVTDIGFEIPKKREEAHKKWNAWWKENGAKFNVKKVKASTK